MDIKAGIAQEIELGVTYSINVYATKPGYENSNISTATLCWIDVEPKTEGIENSIAQVRANAVLIQTGSSGIFGSRHLALLDIETVGKKEFVFLADSKGDTAASGDSSVKINVMVPLSDILEKGKISAIWTFKNKSSTTCSGSSVTPGRPEQELQ